MWIWIILATAIGLLLSIRERYRIFILLRNLPRDIRITMLFFKLHRLSGRCIKEKKTLVGEFTSVVKRHPHKVAIYFEDEIWTFAKLEAYSNQITRYFISQNLKRGDCVALMLDNCAEYPGIIIGLARLGIATALINTNLVKGPLLHSITVCCPKAVIFGTNHWEAIQGILENLPNCKLYDFNDKFSENGNSLNSINLCKELLEVSNESVDEKLQQCFPEDPVVYIYTSGTTGFPKASVMTNTRYCVMAIGITIVAGVTDSDIVYSPLPQYHAGGGIAGVGQAVAAGKTVVTKKKFSASNYFRDCAKYKVTVAQHIGEMCRYILAAYSEKEPEKHHVRTMFGNGINKVIWKNFIEKFGVGNMIELYGSTEGVASLINIDNKIGSVGYIPWFLRKQAVVTLIKCNEMGDPIRNTDGRCIESPVNEPGIVIGKIDPCHAIFNYEGYTDNTATEKKIIRNVLVKGDMYYNSGDILIYDKFGYFYFKDRMGDTFRWKGENVSSCEIESVISGLVHLSDVIVYGVLIPKTEGRAGMAAIVDSNKSLDMASLGNLIKLNLPSYAIPIFIRILDSAPLTGSFKITKCDLRREGYDINVIKDKLYFFDSSKGSYVNFDKELYNDVINSKLRL